MGAGAAQVGAAAGAQQEGATAAGAQQVGATGAAQLGAAEQLDPQLDSQQLRSLLKSLRRRWQRTFLGLQQLLQLSQPQAAGAGAQQLGAAATGAQQLGAAATGAEQEGSTAAGAQQLGAAATGAAQLGSVMPQQLVASQPQPPRRNMSRKPASACEVTQNINAAIDNVIHFIFAISWKS